MRQGAWKTVPNNYLTNSPVERLMLKDFPAGAMVGPITLVDSDDEIDCSRWCTRTDSNLK